MQIKIIIVQVIAASRLEASCSCCGLICFFIVFNLFFDLGFKNILFRIIKQNYFELFLNYFLNHHNLLTIKHKKSQGRNPGRTLKKNQKNKSEQVKKVKRINHLHRYQIIHRTSQ